MLLYPFVLFHVMKRGHAAIAFVVLAVALVGGFLLSQGTITGKQVAAPLRIAQIQMPAKEAPALRAVLPKEKPQAKTEAEVCIAQHIPINDKNLKGCEQENAACLKKSSTEYCNYPYLHCKVQHLDYFAFSVNKCMKNMGVLLG